MRTCVCRNRGDDATPLRPQGRSVGLSVCLSVSVSLSHSCDLVQTFPQSQIQALLDAQAAAIDEIRGMLNPKDDGKARRVWNENLQTFEEAPATEAVRTGAPPSTATPSKVDEGPSKSSEDREAAGEGPPRLRRSSSSRSAQVLCDHRSEPRPVPLSRDVPQLP